jgi:glycosyltransferase involved in cell wall biosynthesis
MEGLAAGYVGAMTLNVAMVAPPWIPVPPPEYGGVEQVVDMLCAALTRRGHDVTLFAAPGTRSEADVQPILEDAHPDEMQLAIYESDHVASAFDAIDEAAATDRPYDIVHDHSGFVAFAFANRLATPLVQTLHAPFSDDTFAFYKRHGSKGQAIAISRYQAREAPPQLRIVDVVYNPIVVDDFPFVEEKSPYLLWVGRMNDDKGPQRAIAAARQAGVPLVLAGPIQPGQEEFFAREVEPHLDDDQVKYVGEIGGDDKTALFAHASAFLMPIRWAEPFGLVMTEAMACGTPVIAFPEGSACEVIADGQTGFLVNDESEMAAAVARLGEIDPARCREWVSERFDLEPVAEAHERAYRRVLSDRPPQPPMGARPGNPSSTTAALAASH